MTGRTSNDSVLPKWSEAFPALIDPSKVRFQDAFLEDPGTIVSRPVPYDPQGEAPIWLESGDIFVHADGFAYSTTATAERAHIETGSTDVEVCANLQWIAGGSAVGLTFRYTDSNNYIRAVLLDTNLLRVQEVVGGTTATILDVPINLIDEAFYKIRVVMVGDAISVYDDSGLLGSVDTENNPNGTKVGMYFLGAMNGHRVHEILIADA